MPLAVPSILTLPYFTRRRMRITSTKTRTPRTNARICTQPLPSNNDNHEGLAGVSMRAL